MGLFELKKPNSQPSDQNKSGGFENTLEGRSDAKLVKFEKMHSAKVSIIEEHMKIPLPGECCFVWTTNQFNTMAFIIWLIKHLGPIENLTITTYSIGAYSISTIMKWFDSGDIQEIFFYVASYARRINSKNTDLLEAQADARPGVTVEYGFNHSKVTLAKIGENYITIVGSGNFSQNAYNEQYTICNDKKIYEFYRSNIRDHHSDGGR